MAEKTYRVRRDLLVPKSTVDSTIEHLTRG